jgi:hypothetical protein
LILYNDIKNKRIKNNNKKKKKESMTAPRKPIVQRVRHHTDLTAELHSVSMGLIFQNCLLQKSHQAMNLEVLLLLVSRDPQTGTIRDYYHPIHLHCHHYKLKNGKYVITVHLAK